MLYYPLKPELALVKRIIGAEGNRIRIVDGRVFRNEIRLDDEFVAEAYRSHEDWGPKIMPEGYYFVMGDHRNNSLDGRDWGFLPKKYIVGKVQVRWWPMGHAKVFLGSASLALPSRPSGGDARADARPGSQPRGRRREAGPRLRDGGRQHRLRRLPVPHRFRGERHRPRRHARGAQAARRGPSLRPSQVRDARRRRHLRLHAPGGARDWPHGAEELFLSAAPEVTLSPSS